jgi:hypothetical protein
MKKLLLLFTVLFYATSFAQVTNEGKPKSWKLLNSAESVDANVLPEFNLKAVKAEDKIRDNDPTKPWRFGYMHSVDFGFENGQWTTLENGDRIFRMLVNSPGALSLNFIFDDFYIPQGGSLYLYSNDRSDLLGAYTSKQNQESGILGTWLVKGDSVWIEYFEPSEVAGEGRLHIAKATHGYRSGDAFEKETKDLGDSGNCNLDVDCPIGDDWENLKDHNKKSVGLLLSGGFSFCTGALINNTSNDGTPYFLTANHCFSNPSAWSFRFGWISPNAVCAENSPSPDGPINMTISGASLRARNANTDFCLVEINNPLPTSWDRVFAGWDKTDLTPDFSVGIHHPSGDIMKVCRDDSPMTKEFNNGAQTWEITSAGNGWELGVTEGGSSGSPLFDDAGKIIGQLFGGGAACFGTEDNDQFDFYGRLGVSWDGSNSSVRLKDWLDPNGVNPDNWDSNPPLEVFALDAGLSIQVPESPCGDTNLAPTLTLTNPGAGDITSAVITWSINGSNETTINYDGVLVQNETATFPLGEQNFTLGNNEITATLVSVNNTTDENTVNDNVSTDVEIEDIVGYVTTQFHLELTTDNWAEETTWEFRTIEGAVLNSGGPYQEGVDDNTTFIEDFDVDPNACYVFEIFDDAEDGICCDFGQGSYSLTDDDGNVVFAGGNFGISETTILKSEEELGVNSLNADAFVLYPNPAEDVLNVSVATPGNFNFTITNTLGQLVHSGSLSETRNAISVSALNTGLYFVTISDEATNTSVIKKIVKE